jgi:diguanylate cyclase (GGDEF)-like protein/PAS domain S-box-containing protein
VESIDELNPGSAVLESLDPAVSSRIAGVPDEAERQKLRLRLLESVVITAHDAVMITEAEPLELPGPRIIYVNEAFTRMTGYSPSEVLGLTPRILQGPKTSAETEERVGAALRRWERCEAELLNYRKDGSTFWVELSVVPVADETGWFTHWVSVQRDVTARKEAEELAVRARVAEARHAALAYRAGHDELTGLLSRSAFLECVEDAIAESRRRPDTGSAVLFLDLDGFKLVNDGLGHRIGDVLLIEIACRLKQCIRAEDRLARMGGDEFAILLTGKADREAAGAVARRILTSLREPLRLPGHSVVVGTSIGMSIVNAACDAAEDVLRDADTAMYRAKGSGGSRLAVFDAPMHARALSALRAVSELSGVVERQELMLHFQPVIEISTGQITALEALVRWNHPERGLVPPNEFIPLAEDTGLIVEIGAWVLRRACLAARAWHVARPGARLVSVAVNVSSRQLADPGFLDTLRAALGESCLEPRALELELTESVFIERPESVGALLEQIRALGVRVVLDDFGTGYSSLSYLERYPIDTLKIDRSFVARLADSRTAAEIVRVIVGLARALSMDVTAEGVEDRAQLELIARCGCTNAQGFFLSRPLTCDAVLPFLRGSAFASVSAAV